MIFELKAHEQRRVRKLHQKITRSLNQRRRYAEQRGRIFKPDQDSIQKRFYCYYLKKSLDRYYLRDLAFLRDPECWGKQEGYCDISSPESAETREFLGGSFPAELLPDELPDPEEDELGDEYEDWERYIRDEGQLLDSLEGTGFYGWSVSLYEYKSYYYVFHEAGFSEYDTYREAKKQIRWA
jgi:hypothetical protein